MHEIWKCDNMFSVMNTNNQIIQILSSTTPACDFSLKYLCVLRCVIEILFTHGGSWSNVLHAVLLLLQNYTRPTRHPLYTSRFGQDTCIISHYSGHPLRG